MSEDLMVPGTGELVPLADAAKVARALDDLGELQREIASARRALQDALIAVTMIEGDRVVQLDGYEITRKGGGFKYAYDAQLLEDGLRAAGMPERRIREIVEEVVTYKVNAVEAKKAASANPAYEQVVRASVAASPAEMYVTVRRTP